MHKVYTNLKNFSWFVTPAKAGDQILTGVDSGFRRKDKAMPVPYQGLWLSDGRNKKSCSTRRAFRFN